MQLLNAFSLNMLPELPAVVLFREIPLSVAQEIAVSEGLESAIGHADTAAVLSGLLEVEVPVNRSNVILEPGQAMMVAQYSGPRLPEGATTLPEGAAIKFILATYSQE